MDSKEMTAEEYGKLRADIHKVWSDIGVALSCFREIGECVRLVDVARESRDKLRMTKSSAENLQKANRELWQNALKLIDVAKKVAEVGKGLGEVRTIIETGLEKLKVAYDDALRRLNDKTIELDLLKKDMTIESVPKELQPKQWEIPSENAINEFDLICTKVRIGQTLETADLLLIHNWLKEHPCRSKEYVQLRRFCALMIYSEERGREWTDILLSLTWSFEIYVGFELAKEDKKNEHHT